MGECEEQKETLKRRKKDGNKKKNFIRCDSLTFLLTFWTKRERKTSFSLSLIYRFFSDAVRKKMNVEYYK
jgi:hypothetical protein